MRDIEAEKASLARAAWSRYPTPRHRVDWAGVLSLVCAVVVIVVLIVLVVYL